MDKVRIIDIKETILSENRDLAGQIRADLTAEKILMLNLMASPGAGKTSLIIETLHRLKDKYRFAIIEGDIESSVDSDKIAALGVPAVQLRTGGSCHLDAPMVRAALDTLDLRELDIIIIENIGNLVCPAEFDLGEHRRVVLLSVPEGDDKPLKYPLIFSLCDLLLVGKTDYLAFSDFDSGLLAQRAHRLNPRLQIIKTSSRSGEGLEEWCRWLSDAVAAARQPTPG